MLNKCSLNLKEKDKSNYIVSFPWGTKNYIAIYPGGGGGVIYGQFSKGKMVRGEKHNITPGPVSYDRLLSDLAIQVPHTSKCMNYSYGSNIFEKRNYLKSPSIAKKKIKNCQSTRIILQIQLYMCCTCVGHGTTPTQ